MLGSLLVCDFQQYWLAISWARRPVRQVAEWLRKLLESEGAVIVSTPGAANKSLDDNSRWPLGFRLSLLHIRVFRFPAAVLSFPRLRLLQRFFDHRPQMRD